MSEINNGGPAFPVCSVCGAQATIRQGNQKLCDKHYRFGNSEKQRATLSLVELDLRDYFAARFAAAMMTATSADHDFPNIDYQHDVGGPTVAERVATIAYRMADAMLKAREAGIKTLRLGRGLRNRMQPHGPTMEISALSTGMGC